jgi:hypothetical protein
MIGKRIVLVLCGVALLIIVSGLLVGSLISQQELDIEVTQSS